MSPRFVPGTRGIGRNPRRRYFIATLTISFRLLSGSMLLGCFFISPILAITVRRVMHHLAMLPSENRDAVRRASPEHEHDLACVAGTIRAVMVENGNP